MTGSPQRQEGQERERLADVVPIRPAIPTHVKDELARLKALWRSQRVPRYQGDPEPVGEAERVQQRALERKYREAP
jgi:hypothetical protein